MAHRSISEGDLPGRSISTTVWRNRRLNPSSERRNRWWKLPKPPEPAPSREGERWKKEEEKLLRRHYTKHGSRYTAAILGRSITSVQDRALKLGIPGHDCRPWSEIERKYLRRKYPQQSAKQIARTLHRTEQSVRGQIHKLRLCGPSSAKWSRQDLDFLEKNYGKLPTADIARQLGRSLDAVQLKAGRIGVNRRLEPFNPSPKELRFVLDNLGVIPFTKIAAQLGTTTHHIRAIAAQNGYRDRPTSRPWTPHDDAELRRIYGSMSRQEVAELLGRTMVAVACRATRLGLTRELVRTREPRPWTKEEETVLRSMYGSATYREIAEILGRTVASVNGHAVQIGIAQGREVLEEE